MSAALPRPISSDWLSLRRQADEASREVAAPLLQELTGYLLGAARPKGPDASPPMVHLFDLGAGTGANQAWLAPRLPFDQHWTLIDHDRSLLDQATAQAHGFGTDKRVETDTVVAGIEQLGELLAGGTQRRSATEPTDAQGTRTAALTEDRNGVPAAVVTCSALLDLLTPHQLAQLCRTLAGTATPAFLSLTVTGEMDLVPPHPDDAVIARAFNAHQQRDGLAGPSAVSVMVSLLNNSGHRVMAAQTPWRLGAGQEAMMQRLLQDRADAVCEQDPSLAETARHWIGQRSRQLDDGALSLSIGHQDILALPAR